MIIFLPKYLEAEVCRIGNIDKFIEKKKIRRGEYPAGRCRCRYCRKDRRIKRIRRCRKFRKLGNGKRVRRVRKIDIR